MAMLGCLFVATTRVSHVKAAVIAVLRPLPFLPAARVGTMIGLVLRSIPLILDEAAEIQAALLARGIERRPLPVRFLALARPLARNTFRRGDELALAMASRLYNEEAAPRLRPLHVGEIGAIAAAAAGVAALWLA